MLSNQAMGIVFSNVHDDLLRELTEVRSMGSVPFGGRYRLIDFSLSNLVNAGITKVGIITRANYQSLMDHLGNGKPWDLDRRKGGLHILPPYGNVDAGMYTGHVDALAGVMNFLERSSEEYVVLCDSDVVCNIDLTPMMEAHIEKQADVTVAYKRGRLPKNHRDIMSFSFGEGGRVKDIELSGKIEGDCDFSLDFMIIQRETLIRLVKEATARNYTSLGRDIFQSRVDTLRIFGWEVDGYAAVMDCISTYVKSSMQLLSPEVRSQLFTRERPVYTKTRDDMPTKYGLGSYVKNSIIADGCSIEGRVENCILFRGVKVHKDAVLRNCIIMQDSVIGEKAELSYVTADKNVRVTEGRVLTGAESYPIFIRKGTSV